MPVSGTFSTKRPVRRMNSANRRQEIVNAAFQSIAATGHLTLSTTELASMVGISQPAIFRHFRSKQQLHDAILDEANQRVLNEFKGLIGQTDRWQDPLKLVRDVLLAMGEHFQRESGIWLTLINQNCLVDCETEDGDQANNTAQCATTQLHYSLKRLCQSAIDAGQMAKTSDADLVASVLVAQLFGLGQQWISSRKSFNLRERLDYALGGFLDGHHPGITKRPHLIGAVA